MSGGSLSGGGLSSPLDADLDVNAFDLLHVDSIFGSTSILPVRIGDAGTTSHSLASEDDLLVTGRLEADGQFFSDSLASFLGGGLLIMDDVPLNLGNASDATFWWLKTQTPHTLFLGLGADSNALVISQRADVGYNFAHALETDPTIFIQSANQSATEWLKLTHDQTDGRIVTGAGNLSIGSGTTSHALTTPNDVFVSGKLEVDGNAFFDGETTVYSTSGFGLRDNVPFKIGSSDDNKIQWSTAQTNDALMLGLSAVSRSIIMIEAADISFDFAHAIPTNPTIFGHSANQSTTEWWSLTHDQTDAVLDTGTGVLQIPDGSKMATSAAPTADAELANKKYVDDNAGGDSSVFITASEGVASGTTITQISSWPCMQYPDAASNTAYYQVRVPAGKTSLSSVDIVYHNQTATANVELTNSFGYSPNDGSTSDVTDSEANTLYGTSGTTNVNDEFSVNAAAFNGLGTLAADGLVRLNIQRIGASGSDTYNRAWNMVGVRFTFA